jgi:hypothetical protein
MITTEPHHDLVSLIVPHRRRSNEPVRLDILVEPELRTSGVGKEVNVAGLGAVGLVVHSD